MHRPSYNFVNFDPSKLSAFKKAYHKANNKYLKTMKDLSVVQACDTFDFEGCEYLLGYAKYVIEYLENKFNQGEDEVGY
jgi:hypothetical protein